MTDNILKFKSEKTIKPKKIRISQSRNSPILEITTSESQIIKKFIEFVQKDVHFQIELFQKAKLTPDKLETNLYTATFLIEYMNVILEQVDKGKN